MRHPAPTSSLALTGLFAVALVFAAGASFAQRNLAVTAGQAAEARVALVIGNAAYKDAPLANPVNDATDVAAALRSLGFRVISRTNAGQREMRTAIREFGNELRRAQVGLFYYAGHGVQVKGNNYLVPVGAEIQSEADAEDLSVDANYILRTMEESQVKVSIAILDACRNNPFARSFRSVSRGLAQMNAATGSLVAFATAPGSVAADGTGRNGIYTKHLLASLKAPDTDILKVFQRTRAEVVKETGGRQTPWESTSLVGDFYFRPGTQVASTAPASAVIPGTDPAANERAFWESVKDSRNAEELRAYLDQFPNGLFATLAQARLNVLAPVPTQVATAAPLAQTLAPTTPADDLQRLAIGTVFRDCADCPDMVVIPPGSFSMGSPESELGRWSSGREGPLHSVAIPHAFAVGKYEVTRGQFAAFVQASGRSVEGCSTYNGREWEMDNSKNWRNPGFFQTDDHPVVCVSWEDAKAFAGWLGRKSGKRYRLLTEAEWEYAARAGSQAARPWGDNANDACRYANVADVSAKSGLPGASGRTIHECSDGRVYTAPVGSYQPNSLGLHDMMGNAWEWTEDCWNDKYAGAPADGSAWINGDCGVRVLRGGSWYDVPQVTRSANRVRNTVVFRPFNSGFRLARSD